MKHPKSVKEILKLNKELREKYGFIKCPKCGVIHTNKTMTCRKCEYKVLRGGKKRIF